MNAKVLLLFMAELGLGPGHPGHPLHIHGILDCVLCVIWWQICLHGTVTVY